MPELNVQVIRSSSAGNCTAVWTPHMGFLIDAGISRTLLCDFISENGNPVDAALITHAHNDHLSNAACNFMLQNGIPLYMGNGQTLSAFEEFLPAFANMEGGIKLFNAAPFRVRDFNVIPFKVDHDAPGGCFGFNVFYRDKKIAYATDLVNVTKRLLPFFVDSDVIVIESNHDVEMLEKSGRPAYVKQRIKNEAHLSNEKCAAFLQTVLKKSRKKPSHLFMAHISSECNSRELVKEIHEDSLLREEILGVKIVLTYHTRASERVTL
jgi:phosphoribosyl 1,2-cyclic phosphodiesterase